MKDAQLQDFAERRDAARAPGSEGARRRQHERGKMLARERIEHLLDAGSFHELDMMARREDGPEAGPRPYTDGVVTGWGTVEGRTVCVYSQDFTVFGGSLGGVHGAKIRKLMDLASSVGAPVVGINDGGGARIDEGVVSLDAYGAIFHRNVRSSGVVPQISVIMGPCAGGAVYSPAMTDFVFMVEDRSYMFITGPDVVKTVTGESVTQQELGGALTHATKSGVCHFTSPDDRACLDDVRHLLSFLPSASSEPPPTFVPTDDPARLCPRLARILPDGPTAPYDMRELVEEVVDDGELFEYAARWAPNVACGFARLDGRSVGVVANQPAHLAGLLDIDACEKAARFVRTCDAFGIPLVTFVDVPGFLPGVDQEHRGIIHHGAKLVYAYCEAAVPHIQVLVRKAYGGAYVAMDSKALGADLSYAWPTAELAVLGPDAAVDVIHKDELRAAEDPEALRARLVAEYAEQVMHPYDAAERGHVDEVIDPAETRLKLVAGLRMLASKREVRPARKHGNVQL